VNSGHTVFQGKRKLLKNPEWYKIYVQYNAFRVNSVFQGNYIVNTVKIFRGNPERWKNFQYSVYSLGSDPSNLG